MKTYTQEEIQSAINKLKHSEDELLGRRKALNSDLRDIKKNIKFYEELDCSQYKAF